MAKLIITLDGAQVGEVAVDKERITIGRRPENDIQLDHIAVSSQHAAIVSILNDSFLEDLGSTNGTVVNGGAVHKHFLRNGDLIEIGRHRMRYIGDVAATRAPSDFEKTMVLNRPMVPAAASGWHAAGDGHAVAVAEAVAAPVLARTAALRAKSKAAAEAEHEVLPEPVQGPLVDAETAVAALLAQATASEHAASDPLASDLAQSEPVLSDHSASEPVASEHQVSDHLVPSPAASGHAVSGYVASDRVASDRVASERAASDAAFLRGDLPNAPAADSQHATAVLVETPSAWPRSEAVSSAAASLAGQKQSAAKAASAVAPAPQAFLQVLNGAGAGRVLEINKPLTTIGRETVQVAVISRRSSGYFVAQVDGDEPARLNNAPLPANAVAMHVHDILEIAGIKLEFFFQD